MSRNPDRIFDKTHLSIDLAEERQLIHRDYLAHCLRWSHTVKYLLAQHKYKDSIIVDVGCGKEMPLAKMLYVNKMTPQLYVGVDVNKMEVPEMLLGKKIPIRLFAETDFCALTADQISDSRRPDLITCFEVLEHVTPSYCRKMLAHMRSVVEPDGGAVIISTPCFNGSAAGNHINEMTYQALGSLFEDLGFTIEDHYGTFASQTDYKEDLGNDAYHVEDGEHKYTLRGAYEALKDYYDSNLLAILFAPLFPSKSRNCLWRLRPVRKEGEPLLFPELKDVEEPWSQHKDYKELAG
jgi:hypothetical protein